MTDHRGPGSQWLDAYVSAGEEETRDIERVRSLCESTADPYDRSLPLHVTGSAVVLHLATLEVLLRWHDRQQAWLQVGGHGDAGEHDPLQVALREAREETGLDDLGPWPGTAVPELVHVVVVPVAPRSDEPSHEHGDVRYAVTTSTPQLAQAETAGAPLRWLPLAEAVATTEPNLAETLRRIWARLGLPDGRSGWQRMK
ncbi:MAG: NUDIX domain-containing protein [Acidimicrobiales bacterium]